jgi:hypothetical protein
MDLPHILLRKAVGTTIRLDTRRAVGRYPANFYYLHGVQEFLFVWTGSYRRVIASYPAPSFICCDVTFIRSG